MNNELNDLIIGLVRSDRDDTIQLEDSSKASGSISLIHYKEKNLLNLSISNNISYGDLPNRPYSLYDNSEKKSMREFSGEIAELDTNAILNIKIDEHKAPDELDEIVRPKIEDLSVNLNNINNDNTKINYTPNRHKILADVGFLIHESEISDEVIFKIKLYYN